MRGSFAREVADIAYARGRYIAESAAQTSATAQRVEHAFQRLYEGLRSMAHFAAAAASEQRIADLDFPAAGDPEVITCDNT